MPQVTSADGTVIGYDRLSDDGPAVVLVSGGLDDGTENFPSHGAGQPSSNCRRTTVEHVGRVPDQARLGRSWRRSMRTARCDETRRSTSVLPRTGQGHQPQRIGWRMMVFKFSGAERAGSPR